LVTYDFVRKDVIRRVNWVEGLVEVVSPLRVGAGRADFDPTSLAKDQVLKDSQGRPVIPGSSWKGVFRSASERIAKGRGLEVCTGLSKDTCLERRRKDREFQNLIERPDQALPLFWDNTCINCKVFGTMSVIGAVSFLDSYPVSPNDYSLGMRTMIAISRKEGAVAGKALVQIEYVNPGSTFTFKFRGVNLPNYVIGYLTLVMEDIHQGLVQIGGHKSRGFGQVRFKRLKLTNSGATKVGEEDVDVTFKYGEEMNGDSFLKEAQVFVEAFKNVKIQYPKKSHL